MRRKLCLLLVAASCCLAQEIDGVWIGDLNAAGNANPILLIFSKSPQGSWSGQVISASRNTTNPLSELAAENKTIRWKVPRVSAAFEGEISPDAESITGQWSDSSGAQRLILQRFRSTSFSVPMGSEIDAFIPKPPSAVPAGGRFYLIYELHLTNWGASEAVVEQVELIIDGKSAKLGGESLAGLFSSRTSRLAPRERSAIILMPSSSDRPKTIGHRLQIRRAGKPHTVDCGTVPVSQDIVRLSPPVRGRDWVMNEGPDVPSHHRTSLIALNGKITNAQRYAFDIHKVSAATKEDNAPSQNTDHASYGEEVVAVADATVASVRAGMPDEVPHGVTLSAPITPETITGNHVVLDLGGGRYALYAHLQPDVRVKPGERVSRGQVLGRIGNSGRSNTPHLHFQVADGPSFEAEGLPFVFQAFEKDGVQHKDEMPLHGWRIHFTSGN